MARPTITSVQSKLENIEAEVIKLNATKVGTEVWQLQYQQLRDDIADLRAEIGTWRFYARWGLLIILGAVVTAVMGLIIKK